MDEMQTHHWQIFNEKYAVVLNKAVFKWDKDVKVKDKDEDQDRKKGS